jgi:hypothetical protein
MSNLSFLAAALNASLTVLVTHKVLFRRNGENITTAPDPVRLFVEGEDEALLQEVENYCVSWDNDMLTKGHVYEVNEVVLPHWLSVEEWVANRVAWKWVWGCGVCPTWPEKVQRVFLKLPTGQKMGLADLLRTKTFRSEFRKSLYTQFFASLVEGRYELPLSARQLGALVGNEFEVKRHDTALYQDRSRNLGAKNHVPVPPAPKKSRAKKAA